MTDQQQMTRDQMQTEAMVVQKLLEAASALQCTHQDGDEAATLVEMAAERAKRLNHALDSVHALEEAA